MNYNYSLYGDSALSGALAGMSIVMNLISIAVSVFAIICMWKIFTKAGEAGWKAIIPFYNGFVFYRIAWEGRYFGYTLVTILIPWILVIIGAASQSSGFLIFAAILFIIAIIIAFVIYCKAMIRLARRFGKPGGFAAGLIFLSPVFMGILAFDNSDYDVMRA